MAASTEDWSCDSNRAVRVSFVQPHYTHSSLTAIHQFHPKFTYPIFGTEERIFGYQGLDIEIRFTAHDCSPNVTIKYDKKFNQVGDVQPTDCAQVLHDFMPPPAFEDAKAYEETILTDVKAQKWTPPGTKVHEYERNGRTFEIWSGSLSDINVRHQLDQIQIFVLFFIEGGQMLALDDPEWTLARWQVYFVYEKTQTREDLTLCPYVLAGYATTYRCWTLTLPKDRSKQIASLHSFPDVQAIDPTRENCRLRISQVVVLPPFQASGHGSELYQVIYRQVMADDTINELTVEDPSEEFDKLRDVNDWKILEPAFKAANIKIDTGAVARQSRHEKIPKKKLLNMVQLESIRKAHKMAPRQFYRCMELYFLAQIPYSHRAAGGASLTKLLIKKHKNVDPVDVTYYWLRNIIKARIWRQNSDKFTESSPSEVVELINDVTRGQEDEYEGYLLRLAAKAADSLNGSGGGSGPAGVSLAVGGAARKRKIIEDDDDDGAASDASKKARA